MICENCSSLNNGKYGSGRFCCIKCARSFSSKVNRNETNKKISLSLMKEPNSVKCKYCNIDFSTKRKLQKFCSKSCGAKYISSSESGIKQRRDAGLKSAEITVKRSKNEIYFSELCSKYFNTVLTNKSIFNGWDADIIIEDFKIAVLWNGRWHYEKIKKNHSLSQVKNRDDIKIKEIIKCGYTPYVIKDLGSYNRKFVESEFEKLIKKDDKE